MSSEKKNDKKLENTLDEAEWSWLKPHAQRDGIILVSQRIELLRVANSIATDSSQEVKVWIDQGIISKPTVQQIEAWDQNPTKKFLSVVVQPYVLIQEITLH